VIDPDNSSNDYEIPVASMAIDSNGCAIGPLYVAATINQQAFVVTVGLPGTNCGPGGDIYKVNLATKSVTASPNASCGGGNVVASQDGSMVALGETMRAPVTFAFITRTRMSTEDVYNIFGGYKLGVGSYRPIVAIAGDANVVSSLWMFTDSAANIAGWVALPAAWGTASQPLLQPQLNGAGSLYYMADSRFVDIVDVQHGLLKMRFSLGETIANTAAPMAIDSGGQHVYLITDKGLTIVDLGGAPLSIGHLLPGTASAGAQIVVRGSVFGAGLTLSVGGQQASVNVIDENTLSFTMPDLKSGPQDVVLRNGDGSEYTLENGVKVP
jgi:hypothetical protein